MTRVLTATRRFLASTQGQDLTEYAILVALIAIVAVGAVTTLGQTVYNVLWVPIASSI